MEFTPYRSVEQYKCGAFLERQLDDKTLRYFYSSINHLVSLLSATFPHEELLNRQALTGDLDEIRKSIETKYLDWWVVAKRLASHSVQLSFNWNRVPCFLRFVQMLCLLLFKFPSRKQSTDSRHDGCKRKCFNTVMMLFILLDVFAAATLLITGQYGEYGIEELPSRLNYCIDDLNLRIRKLLIDDYQMLNRTLFTCLSDAGHEVIERIKTLTGADAIDKLINISRSAEDIDVWINDIRMQLWKIVEDYSQFEVDFGRMRHTLVGELKLCCKTKLNL
ncbi:hypothetical protein KIN20_016138 [Parelaphostrongylus tenuis]|uniref:Uncharacterized protein n=1 Tax=Parelaphostrongylus tenuis TaxID=148309 RepID=A0AAD5QQI1_PARTN|nr:hypothetical protein KIN20_016138 [Parelaphostrongylus tenuis]